MPYQPPSEEVLIATLNRLDQTTHSERKQTIQRLQSLCKATQNPDIILGALILESEKISIEYTTYGLSPEGGYLYSGSDLFKELNSILNNTSENFLTTETKIQYLLAYYRYQKSIIEDKDDGKSPIDAEFKPVQDHLLRQLPNLQAVIKERPDLGTIQRRLRAQPDLYEEEKSGRWKSTNLENIKFIQLLKVLTNYCMDDLIDSIPELNKESDKHHFRYSVYYGALLYMMKQIELEYSGFSSGVISTVTMGAQCTPEKSSVYRFCQTVLNIDHTNDIPDAAKVNLFVDFARFIELAKKNKLLIQFLSGCKLKEGYFGYTRGPLGPTYFTDVESYLQTIYENLEHLVTKQSFIWSCTQSLGSYVAQTLIAMTCLELGAVVYAAGIGVNALPPVFSRFGYRFLGGTLGAKLASQFAKAIEPGIMTNIYGSSIYYGCKLFYNQVNPPKDPIYRAQLTSKQFAAEFKMDLERPREKPNDLLIAILELPTSIISDKVKHRVREIIVVPLQPEGLILDAEYDIGAEIENDPLFHTRRYRVE